MQLNKGNVVVKIGDGEMSEAFTTISDAIEITWDGFNYDTEDVTTHNTTDRAKSMVTTLYNSGKVDFTILYNPGNTQHAALKALNASGAANNFTLIIDNVLDYTFEAYVQTMAPQMAIGQVFKYKVSLLINGAVIDND